MEGYIGGTRLSEFTWKLVENNSETISDKIRIETDSFGIRNVAYLL
jgi:hypothetical protein